MAEAKEKAAEEKPVRVEIIAQRGVCFTGRGTIYPGSVVELSAGHAAQAIGRKWAKKTDAKLVMKTPKEIADQLGLKPDESDG